MKKDTLAEMRKIGIIRQKQKDLFVMRLHVVGGDCTAAHLRAISDVASRYGRGMVHLSTRQGMEIHDVRGGDLESAMKDLAVAGIDMGACGPRIRIIVACPGSATCSWGLIETKSVANDLDREYFRRDTPYKFKMAVTGCPNNCARAAENDIGVMGGVLPRWEKEPCTRCDLCVRSCPRGAIQKRGDEYQLVRDACILCGVCIARCPVAAWREERRGYSLFIGGTMGKNPRLATRLRDLIAEREELDALIARAVRYYQRNGKPKERFGHMIDRAGVGAVAEAICGSGGNDGDNR